MLGNISEISTKAPCEAALMDERHTRIEISDFVMRAFVPIQGKDSSHAVFFLATSLLSESMVSFDPLCGIAARKETMKLAGLRLHVIWTLPFFSYLNLVRSKEKTEHAA